jgi:putative membrane protein insertion efficiency factor
MSARPVARLRSSLSTRACRECARRQASVAHPRPCVELLRRRHAAPARMLARSDRAGEEVEEEERACIAAEARERTAAPSPAAEAREPVTPAVAAALRALQWYRTTLSPLMPRSCRFVPSCSEYSIGAYKSFGLWRGTLLTAWRLVRCNPLNPSFGLDLPRWPPWASQEEA